MAAAAAALRAVNGAVSKAINPRSRNLVASTLSEVRMTGAVVAVVIVLLAIAPARLKVSLRNAPFLVV